MNISSFSLQNFKDFEKNTISFGKGLNILVGPNNCGKSSLLEAVFLAFRFVEKTGGVSPWKKNKSTGRLTGTQLEDDKDLHLPYPSAEYISKDLTKRQKKETRTGFLFSVFSEGENYEIRTEVSFQGQSNVNIYTGAKKMHSGYEKEERGSEEFQKFVKENIQEKKVCFVPVFSGFVPKEQQQVPDAINNFIHSGKTNEVLRNKILGMSNESFDSLQSSIKKTFNIEISKAKALGNSAVLLCEYIENGHKKNANFDVFAAGSGFQQILHLLVYILSSEAEIILIDEPDAHLHFDLQKKIYSVLKDIAENKKNPKQIIVSTHSFEIINLAQKHGSTKVFLVNKESEDMKSIDDNAEIIRWLFEEGIVGIKTLQKFTERLDFLIIENQKEGKDIVDAFLKKIDINNRLEDPLFEIISGKGEGTKVRYFLEEAEERDQQKIYRTFFVDNDGLNQQEIDALEVAKSKTREKYLYTDGFEVENYLLNPSILTRAINKNSEFSMSENLFEESEKKIIEILEQIVNNFDDQILLFQKIKEKLQKEKVFSTKDEAENEARKRAKELLRLPFEEKLKKLPGKELFKLLKAEVHTQLKVRISELDVAESFKREEIPEIFQKLLSY